MRPKNFIVNFFILLNFILLQPLLVKANDIYKAIIMSKVRKVEAVCGDRITIPITVKNLSSYTWNSLENKTFISYHLANKNGKIIKWDNVRTPLPASIKPNKESQINLIVEVPNMKGICFSL